jgi:hypothetical protein
MPRFSHARMQELVATHALNALEPAESAMVTDHLRECPRCRAELDTHLETAAMLAGGGEDAPPAVWERIAAELDGPHPPLQLAVIRGQRAVVRRALSLGAVAAAVAITVLAWQAVRLEDRTQELRDTIAQSDGAQAALAAFTDPAARRVQLTSPDGSLTVAAALLPDGQGWMLAESLPDLPEGRIYQLWWVGAGQKVSLGIIDRHTSVIGFRADPGLEMLVVTQEEAPGVAQSTNPPVAAGHVRA